ncbi:response regulator transcription factor [Campylobacter sp. RM13119]|uniref:response regulator transcription factor n=1 Tax=Campylobacter californiensis TaxID=1032243 RepID=UPI00147502C1|nr:response regulator transcription factor [Campylobacter sp. RM13119]MBE3606923.1 response regulator transcription factor [Campylobacter sp. RM13119]
MFKILVAEDDELLNEMIQVKLKNEGFSVKSAFNGVEAVEILESEHIDLLITDVMMPLRDGYGLAKEAKLIKESLPILMITAKSEIVDIHRGFLSGADDYMSKPINLKELVLRVNALLRRAKIVNEKRLSFKDTELDYNALSVSINGEKVELTPKEFYLLFLLLSNEDKIFTSFEIMQEIWGFESGSDERVVDTHIKKLRQKFEHTSDFEIVTIRGLGYKGKIS